MPPHFEQGHSGKGHSGEDSTASGKKKYDATKPDRGRPSEQGKKLSLHIRSMSGGDTAIPLTQDGQLDKKEFTSFLDSPHNKLHRDGTARAEEETLYQRDGKRLLYNAKGKTGRKLYDTWTAEILPSQDSQDPIHQPDTAHHNQTEDTPSTSRLIIPDRTGRENLPPPSPDTIETNQLNTYGRPDQSDPSDSQDMYSLLPDNNQPQPGYPYSQSTDLLRSSSIPPDTSRVRADRASSFTVYNAREQEQQPFPDSNRPAKKRKIEQHIGDYPWQPGHYLELTSPIGEKTYLPLDKNGSLNQETAQFFANDIRNMNHRLHGKNLSVSNVLLLKENLHKEDANIKGWTGRIISFEVNTTQPPSSRETIFDTTVVQENTLNTSGNFYQSRHNTRRTDHLVPTIQPDPSYIPGSSTSELPPPASLFSQSNPDIYTEGLSSSGNWSQQQNMPPRYYGGTVDGSIRQNTLSTPTFPFYNNNEYQSRQAHHSDRKAVERDNVQCIGELPWRIGKYLQLTNPEGQKTYLILEQNGQLRKNTINEFIKSKKNRADGSILYKNSITTILDNTSQTDTTASINGWKGYILDIQTQDDLNRYLGEQRYLDQIKRSNTGTSHQRPHPPMSADLPVSQQTSESGTFPRRVTKQRYSHITEPPISTQPSMEQSFSDQLPPQDTGTRSMNRDISTLISQGNQDISRSNEGSSSREDIWWEEDNPDQLPSTNQQSIHRQIRVQSTHSMQRKAGSAYDPIKDSQNNKLE